MANTLSQTALSLATPQVWNKFDKTQDDSRLCFWRSGAHSTVALTLSSNDKADLEEYPA